ncbi:hypothetical protein [Streptomyces vietnamensis]|uniref:hypothetical protein n=1 Tax=Streptomyces vietnamensis TaxID=362257 RepID=UPI00343A5A34
MAAPRRSAKAAADTSDEHEVEGAEQEAEQPASAEAGPTVMERAYMDALQRERAGYEMRGLTDRVNQVDAELKRFNR